MSDIQKTEELMFCPQCDNPDVEKWSDPNQVYKCDICNILFSKGPGDTWFVVGV